MKNLVYRLWWPLLFASVWMVSCKPRPNYTHLEGKTFGTFYSIKYNSDQDYRSEIESLFAAYANGVSKYDGTSEVTEFNRTGYVKFKSPYLRDLVLVANDIYQITDGAMDPTVMPLIEAWGFGTGKFMQPDSLQVDSLMSLLGFDEIIVTDSALATSKPGVTIDLNAVGEGYGIDLVGKLLEQKEIKDFMIEIGGEVLCRGVNYDGRPWRIGIENPEFAEKGSGDRLFAEVKLTNEAIGTSGSYRRYYTDSLGVKRPHIINPKTGYPVQHNLLSVTVKANTCTLADGLATACMVLGVDEGKKLIERVDGVEALFIFDGGNRLDRWASEGFFTPEK